MDWLEREYVDVDYLNAISKAGEGQSENAVCIFELLESRMLNYQKCQLLNQSL